MMKIVCDKCGKILLQQDSVIIPDDALKYQVLFENSKNGWQHLKIRLMLCEDCFETLLAYAARKEEGEDDDSKSN